MLGKVPQTPTSSLLPRPPPLPAARLTRMRCTQLPASLSILRLPSLQPRWGSFRPSESVKTPTSENKEDGNDEKNVCSICLQPVIYSDGEGGGFFTSAGEEEGRKFTVWLNPFFEMRIRR